MEQATVRTLRERPKPNYKEPTESSIYKLVSERPPKRLKPSKEPDIYPIEVVEEDSTQVKIHYIGYSARYDEWKAKEDIINIGDDDPDPNPEDPGPGSVITARFSLYQELVSRIKAALNSGRKDSPVVKIDLPFDRIEFNGGLRMCGTQKRLVRAIQHYSISRYEALDELLGKNWHYRGINCNRDFCYVILNTVDFYIYHRRSLKEYVPKPGQAALLQYRDMGDMLVFTFVKGNGTPDRFGTDKDIFFH